MSDQHVRIAHLAVARGAGRLLAIGLGSCVAVVIYDRQKRVGGLAHVLLPDPSAARDDANAARFATRAIPALLAAMRAIGAKGPFEAKLAGGASIFGSMLGGTSGPMGDRNVAAAREALALERIPITGSETGGSSGRSVTFDVSTGIVQVRGVRGGQRVL